MKQVLLITTALTLAAGVTYAAGLDRSGQGVNIIFEEGIAAQLSYSLIDPSISGSYAGTVSGDIGQSYGLPQLSFKTAITDTSDLALIYDQPYGAHVIYGSAYALSINPNDITGKYNLRAEAKTHALTAILRKKLDNRFSVYGGLRVQTVDTNVAVPFVNGYTVTSDSPTDFGYLLGASWENPKIAARVAVTYNSKITHTLRASETVPNVVSTTTPVDIETPQSLNLDFQTGIAENTLIFGTARWVNWSDFDYSPPIYASVTGGASLVGYENDAITYTLGVGHRFSDAFSAAFQVGYEQSQGNLVSNLGPTDGFWSVGVGGTYSRSNFQYSGGIRYIKIGNATTDIRSAPGASFSDNSALALGLQITYRFEKRT